MTKIGDLAVAILGENRPTRSEQAAPALCPAQRSLHLIFGDKLMFYSSLSSYTIYLLLTFSTFPLRDRNNEQDMGTWPAIREGGEVKGLN